jgi:hypothetical protein
VGEWPASLLSFLNLQKYPPSLLYLCMTLGPLFIALAWLDREPGLLGRKLIVLGRVPLFFYGCHLYLGQLLAGLWSWIRDGQFVLSYRARFASFRPPLPPNYCNDNNLRTIYVAWALVTVLLYPLCPPYGRWKRRGKASLWSYL